MVKMIKSRTQNDRGLNNVFYMIEFKTGWWQLRLKENHYVVSAVSSKEKVLDCLYLICKRYKTYNGLARALRECEHKVSREYIDKCKDEYFSKGRFFDEEVEEVVLKASEDIQKNSPLKRKRTIITSPSVSPIEEKKEEEVVAPIVNRTTKTMPKRRIGLIKITE